MVHRDNNYNMELILMLCLLTLWTDCASTQEMKCEPGVVNVPEGDDVLLPCVNRSGSVDEFDWWKNDGEKKSLVFEYSSNGFKGLTKRVSFFPEKLASGNASIILKNTDLKDKGNYTCGLGLVWQERKTFQITLNVDCVLKIRNEPGAARVPHINTTDERVTWRLLECTAHGVPEPELEWFNSAGEVLNKSLSESKSGGSQVKLLLNVTQSDSYLCVAIQRDICHRISNTRRVIIPEDSTVWAFIKTVAAAVAITTVVLVLVFGIIITKVCARNRALKERALRAESKLIPLPD